MSQVSGRTVVAAVLSSVPAPRRAGAQLGSAVTSRRFARRRLVATHRRLLPLAAAGAVVIIVCAADLAATRPTRDRDAVRSADGMVGTDPTEVAAELRQPPGSPDNPRRRRDRLARRGLGRRATWISPLPCSPMHRGSTPARRVASSRRCAVDGAANFEIDVRSTRWGTRPIGPLQIVAATPWASFRWSTFTARHGLTTLPLPPVFDVDASLRPTDGLVGLHRSARPGEGNEFAGIRPFRTGDRLRRINWTRSARSNELQVNSTWADLDTHIALVVDADRRLRCQRRNRRPRFEHRPGSASRRVRSRSTTHRVVSGFHSARSERRRSARCRQGQVALNCVASSTGLLAWSRGAAPRGVSVPGFATRFHQRSVDGGAVAADRTRGARPGRVARPAGHVRHRRRHTARAHLPG